MQNIWQKYNRIILVMELKCKYSWDRVFKCGKLHTEYKTWT